MTTPATFPGEHRSPRDGQHGAGSAVDEAARRLREAAISKRPCAPVRDLLTDDSIDDAYAVQQINLQREIDGGRRLLGWKIGLTSSAVQRQLGVDQPDFGALVAEGGYGDDEPIPLGRLLQPKVEAEVAFVLDRDLTEGPVTAVDVIRATSFVMPVIEVADSRIAGWDITIVDTIADNASAGVFVLGPKPTRLSDIDLREVQMAMTKDGTPVSAGSGAACLGHPVNAVVWLANTLAALGRPLEAGHVVLSGALGPMVAVAEAGRYEAVLTGLGSVRARFSGEAA
jgi:2-keto-4-pentenoate hydratase